MFAKRIKELRNKRHLTQSEMADKIDVARTTYAMYEQGNREPDFETLTRLSDFFEVSIDYLLGRVTTDSNELLKIAHNLDENQESYHKVEVNGKIISLSQKEFEILEAIKKYPVAMDNLKSNPEKKVKQMITSWRKIEEAMKEIDDDDGDYLE